MTLTGFLGNKINFDHKNIDKLSFMFYSEKSTRFDLFEVEEIDIYGCKKIIIETDENILSKTKILNFEKCDLSFINNELLSKLINLKEIHIDNCKNLKSLNGIPETLNKIIACDTKIEDCDISAFENIKIITNKFII